MKSFCILLLLAILGTWAYAQEYPNIPIPENLPQSYPRIFITQDEKGELEKTIKNEAWSQQVLSGIHDRIDEHVYRHVDDPEWMVSRLQMYWKTKATNVYVNGIDYSHADGEAPVPTVRFAGSRNPTTNYGKPKLENITPYMDDPRGLYLPNRSREGAPFEWVEPSKTGNIIANINREILGLGRDAAFLYWLEGDDRFAKFSFDIFDIYMKGMSYRSEPIDLLHGHIQTLVGFTHFQVIHEGALESIAELYDFLHPYIELNHSGQIAGYDITIKRWIDQIIKNGVPQNNWNLHQANIILKAMMVLKDNQHYEDSKGRGYYVDYVLNVTSVRQWSLTKFMDYGYDENNGIWNECPGYAQGVTRALTSFIVEFDNSFNFNLLPYAPVMEKAVKVLPQYQFPNGQTVGFGDTYYGPVSARAVGDLVRLTQKHRDNRLEEELTALLLTMDPNAGSTESRQNRRADISSFFASKPLELNMNYTSGDIQDYITQTFYAPNVSWHVQRMSHGKDGMMVSLNGSLGNHMHANGINMELYGKGFVQGADPGKGAGYLDAIYLEYYSQFPAHNTVMVDGTSSYTEMLSNHAFDLMGEYPKSEQKDGYYQNITYSDVYFLEPETRSDQRRIVSIVKTGEDTGYYVDIFRSKKQRSGDKFHDYYYHNLGQNMQIMDAAGNQLKLTPSEEMGFAGGHLYALDYMWDKKSTRTDDDYQVEWKIDMSEGDADVFMNLWMKGTEGREVYSIKSPPNKAFRGNHGLPYEVSKEPYLTFAARQHGEAWDHPFVSIFEPFTSEEGKSIAYVNGFEDENGNRDFAGIHVVSKSGREDYVFATTVGKTASYKGMLTDASYAVIVKENDEALVLFMGNGTMLSGEGYAISAKEKGNVALEQKQGAVYLHNEVKVTIAYKNTSASFEAGTHRKINF